MRRVLWLIVAVCGVHVLASLAWASRHPAPVAYFTPRPVQMGDPPCALTSAEPEFDAGHLTQGAQLKHTFRVENKTAQPVTIDRVESTCGCTVAEVTRQEVPPSASLDVPVTFTSGAMTGSFHKTVRLFLIPSGSLALSVKGRVLPDFMADPVALSLGRLKPGETSRRRVVIYPTRPDVQWTYGTPYTMDPDLAVSEPVKNGDRYELELTLTARRPGPRAGVLTLPGKVPLFVRYSAQVVK